MLFYFSCEGEGHDIFTVSPYYTAKTQKFLEQWSNHLWRDWGCSRIISEQPCKSVCIIHHYNHIYLVENGFTLSIFSPWDMVVFAETLSQQTGIFMAL